MFPWASKQKGFTIVELLIVIVVIAILAAITIVAYNGIQNRAKSTSLQSSAAQAGKKIQASGPTNNDLYPQSSIFETSASLAASDLNLPPASNTNTYDYFVSDDRKSFCISISDTTATPVASFAYTNYGQVVQGRCIKNLAINPSAETNTSSWTSGQASQMPLPTSNENLFGVVSVQQVPTAAGSTYLYLSNTPVAANQPYSASVTVKNKSSASRTLFIGLVWRDSTGAGIGGQVNSSNATVATNQSTRISVNGSAPAGAVSVQLQMRNSGAVVGDIYAWDGALITDGSTADYPYYDGSSANWSWTGTAHASASFGPATL